MTATHDDVTLGPALCVKANMANAAPAMPTAVPPAYFQRARRFPAFSLRELIGDLGGGTVSVGAEWSEARDDLGTGAIGTVVAGDSRSVFPNWLIRPSGGASSSSPRSVSCTRAW